MGMVSKGSWDMERVVPSCHCVFNCHEVITHEINDDLNQIKSNLCIEQWIEFLSNQTKPLILTCVLLKITDATDDLKLRNIYAGGDCSFATCVSNEVPT